MHFQENISRLDIPHLLLDELMMEPCCALKYYPAVDVCQNEKVGTREQIRVINTVVHKHVYCHVIAQDGDQESKRRAVEQAEEEDFGNSRRGLVSAWLRGGVRFRSRD